MKAIAGSGHKFLPLFWYVGVLVLMTGGIAAAFVGHAITRFSFFMTMGPPRRAALEQIQSRSRGSGDGGAYIIAPRGPRRG